jgi:hypothetical protein
MSDEVKTAEEAIERLNCRDPTLKRICLCFEGYDDAEVSELVDCLLANPDVVTHVFLYQNLFTDETGLKVAQYVAASSTIKHLSLTNNELREPTYLALAAALRINTSLRKLFMWDNEAEDHSRIDAAFTETLRINPNRPIESEWHLYSYEWEESDFSRLQTLATQLGSLSMIS